MPSIQDFSLQYARRIENALNKDNFVRGSKVRRTTFNSSYTHQEILNIRNEINGLFYEGSSRLISVEDKRKIIDGIIQSLQFNNNFPIYESVRKSVSFECASNDHFSDLGNTIEQILRDNK